MSRLVLLGGPTGVGKSTALKLLHNRLSKSALLDADDVWRISIDLAVDGTRVNALSNVVNVLRGYHDAGCELAVVGWVFARPQLYEPVIAGVADLFDSTRQLYLTASEDALRRRLAARGDLDRLDYAVSRLELIQRLPYPKIDTTDLSPLEVADALAASIGGL